MAENNVPLRARDRQRATDAAVREILGLERESVLQKTQRLRRQRLAAVREQPAPPSIKALAKPKLK